jgi:hypothetical protein
MIKVIKRDLWILDHQLYFLRLEYFSLYCFLMMRPFRLESDTYPRTRRANKDFPKSEIRVNRITQA